MAQTIVEESADRVIIVLDPGGPIELDGLSESFASLARYYERHYRPAPEADTAPKLFVTRLSTGSILLEIAPYVVLLGQAFSGMGGAVTVADFANRLSHSLRAFADPHALTLGSTGQSLSLIPPPSRDDAADLREFIRPLTGKRGAALGIRHARFRSSDGERETVAEFSFDETEINRAAANIEKTLSSSHLLAVESKGQKEYKEVMLFFQQTSRSPSREAGRTADRAVVPDISDKPLPTYFRKSVNDLKDKMIRGEDNPMTKGFIVDVHVQIIDNEPKAYIVTEVHDVIDLDDPE
jgi:hypothetical protein